MNEVSSIEAAEVVAPIHKNVWCALAAAQAEMEMVSKGAINPAFKGEGKPKGTAYADLADVVTAVKRPLSHHGIAFYHQLIPGDTHIMRTVLVHGYSESRIECDIPLIIGKNDMQGMKSATTYAKRIGLESLTGVAPDDDDGNAAAAAAPRHQRQEQPKPVDHTAKADAMIAALKSKGISMTDHPRWTTDLEALRKVSADNAARVDVAVKELTPDPNADLGGDEIPY